MAPKQTKRSTRGRGTAPKAATPRRAERVLQSIVAELQNDRGAKAVRLHLDAEAHSLFPKGDKLGAWLVKAAGKEAATKLIGAWATFACFYCKKGLDRCEQCGGIGGTESRVFCDECLGLGVIRCDCCDGSGWITIDCVPSGLRPAVVVERVSLARHGMQALLKKPLPKPTARNPAATIKRCMRLLLAANGLLGVFENAVVALRGFRQSSAMPREKIGKLLKACVEAGAAGEVHVRRLLEHIAAAARLEANAAKADPNARRLSLRWAEAYEKLSKSKTYAGTMLEHPFLKQVTKRAIANAPARGGIER